MDMSLSKLWDIVKDRETWYAAVHGVAKNWKQLSDWPKTMEEMEGKFICVNMGLKKFQKKIAEEKAENKFLKRKWMRAKYFYRIEDK